MLPWIRVVAWWTIIQSVFGEFYSTFSGQQISPAKYEQYKDFNLVPMCAIEVKQCDPKERRRIDCSCNNLHYPARGATYTPYRRMLPPSYASDGGHRPAISGDSLPSARRARVNVMSDGRKASPFYTHMVPNTLVFLAGDVTSIHDTLNYVVLTTNCCQPGGDKDPRCQPIQVPDDDPHLRMTNVRCLNLTRAITYQDLGCAPNTLPRERINTSPPMLELSAIYGNVERNANRSREYKGGRLKSETVNGKEWPPSGSPVCVLNRAPEETRCHNTPNNVPNGLMGPNVMSIWLWRQHNSIARELEAMNPCWDDDRIFSETREITIAFMNQIVYYELMVVVLGYDFLLRNGAIYNTMGHINDYDEQLEPRVSIEFVIVTRWFHTMQEARINKYNNKGKLLDQLDLVDMTTRTGVLPNNRTLEGITQGFFRQPCADADYIIDPSMGERVLSNLQHVSDVMSSDIQKNRDVGLPSYNMYRKLCGLPVAKSFDDLRMWMHDEQVEGIERTYEHVDDIDLLIGIIGEKLMPGASTPPTLACVMVDQMIVWRRADRFWYENYQHPGAFTPEQLYQIRQHTMARLMCDHGDEVEHVTPNVFLVPGPGNEIVDCKYIKKASLEPWRDPTCAAKTDKQAKEKDPEKKTEAPFSMASSPNPLSLGSGYDSYYGLTDKQAKEKDPEKKIEAPFSMASSPNPLSLGSGYDSYYGLTDKQAKEKDPEKKIEAPFSMASSPNPLSLGSGYDSYYGLTDKQAKEKDPEKKIEAPFSMTSSPNPLSLGSGYDSYYGLTDKEAKEKDPEKKIEVPFSMTSSPNQLSLGSGYDSYYGLTDKEAKEKDADKKIEAPFSMATSPNSLSMGSGYDSYYGLN